MTKQGAERVRATLVDQNDRDRIRTDLDETFVVEAAAGTGKTSEMIERIVAVIAAGRAGIDEVVAVTFTEKAAGELKLRLRSGLEKARKAASASAEQQRVEAALAHLEEAHVDTIHGFCAEMLRERPVEAGVDPQFELVSEAEQSQLLDEAFDRWLQQTLNNPPEGVRRSLRRVAAKDGPVRRLRYAASQLLDWRDFHAPWRREPFDRERRIDALVERVHDAAALTARCGDPSHYLYRDTAPLRSLSDDIRRHESVLQRDYDGLEGSLIQLLRQIGKWKGRAGRYGDGLSRDAVLTARDGLIVEIDQFAAEADADLAALLQQELRGIIDGYEALKRRSGRLDFMDLLLRTRALVREHRTVREDFQARFKRIFVDEFQDTDPLQAEILLLLSSDDLNVTDWRKATPIPGKLFIVGDPKQSIYRFRRADVGIYQQVKAQLCAQGAVCLTLRTSFRAVPSIQRLINAAFQPIMTEDQTSLQAAYVALSPFRQDTDTPAIVALPVPEPYSGDRVTSRQIGESLPDAVGAFVHWLLTESAWKVSDRDNPEIRLDLEARHICLLFRQLVNYGRDQTRPYIEALEARGVRHLLVGGRSFHAREEVEGMRAALTAIEWPEDELSVFATLRGSLFAIGDEELFEYHQRFRHFRPYSSHRDELPDRLLPIADVLEILRDLHRRRNRRPAAETVSELLERTRAHAAFALRPSGEQVLANVLQVLELARQYETNGGISFRGFVERLNEEADKGTAAEAPILEEASEGVRLMSAHKAKGLEFPVVILADLTSPLVHENPERHLDSDKDICALRIGGFYGWPARELLENEVLEKARDEAEAVRLIYVAATRARDVLVVPAIGGEPFEGGWLSPLNRGLYPTKEKRRASRPAGNCPKFGNDTVLNSPGGVSSAAFVKPGLHQLDGYDVIWWDPSALKRGAKPSFGIRQARLIGKDALQEVVEARLRAYNEWRSEKDAAAEQAAKPSLSVCTVKQHTETGAKGDGVQLIVVSRDPSRPAGPRFGSLVHAVLGTVPLTASRQQIHEITRLQARILGALDEEVEAAARAVENALMHSLMDRARGAAHAGNCRRETPITVYDNGVLVEGVVDLAFLEDGSWSVVDFKTDREVEKEIAVYRRQVVLYAAAIARATGQPATAMLMQV